MRLTVKALGGKTALLTLITFLDMYSDKVSHPIILQKRVPSLFHFSESHLKTRHFQANRSVREIRSHPR